MPTPTQDTHVTRVLADTRIKTKPLSFQAFKLDRPGGGALQPQGVFVTEAGQLLGSFTDLEDFRVQAKGIMGPTRDPQRQWRAAPVVAAEDWERLGVAHLFPHALDQIAVMLPRRAQVASFSPEPDPVTAPVPARTMALPLPAAVSDLKHAYRLAYSALGDYCGGGEAATRVELTAILDAVFRFARLG